MAAASLLRGLVSSRSYSWWRDTDSVSTGCAPGKSSASPEHCRRSPISMWSPTMPQGAPPPTSPSIPICTLTATPGTRSYNYPPVWLLLGKLGINGSHTEISCHAHRAAGARAICSIAARPLDWLRPDCSCSHALPFGRAGLRAGKYRYSRMDPGLHRRASVSRASHPACRRLASHPLLCGCDQVSRNRSAARWRCACAAPA